MAQAVRQQPDAESTIPAGDSLAATADHLIDTALRIKGERDAAVKLLRRTLEIREAGIDGPHKTDVRAFLARIGEPVIITRFARQRALERDIVAFNPNTVEASELLASFERALTDRYGEARTTDLRKCFAEVCEALNEVER